MTASPLRLALVGPTFPFRGGIAHFQRSLARGLRAQGHTVAEWTFTRQYPAFLFPGQTQFETDAPPPGVPLATRLLDSIGPRSWGATAAALRAWAPDAVVFSHWMPFFAPAYGTIARQLRRAGIRTLALVHNALPHEGRLGDRLLSRYFLGACDGAIALSASVAQDLAALGIRAPVRRVAHPVYDLFGEPLHQAEARAALGLAPGVPLLLFFGFIRAYKGLHVLLEALPVLREQIPTVQAVVAGEFYEGEARYRELAKRLHLAPPTLRFDARYIPTDEVAQYFGAADVVVQPYVTATQSGVAQIAYQFGRPVVTTDVGGLAETVPDGEAGLVVPPNDPAALAAALGRFFTEPGLAAHLTAGAARQRERFGWNPVLDAVTTLTRR